MKQHPLTNEKTFEKWLTTMSCNGCFLFIDEKCTHEKAETHNKDKAELVEDALKHKDDFSINWAKNINDYFLCEDYNNMNLK